MRAKKKLLSLLLGGLIAGLLPTTALAAGTTDTGKGIQTGAACISGYGYDIDSDDYSYDYIYYGTWDSKPIKWRVLSTNGNGGTYVKADGSSYDGQPLFLLSEILLGTGATGEVIFNSNMSNVWQGSEAQSWCGNFSTTSFTVSELDAVLQTTKSDAAYTPSASTYEFSGSENILSGDRVFFLSAEEAERETYGFGYAGNCIAQYGSADSAWWLRSADNAGSTGKINEYGRVDRHIASDKMAARPAFNLNPDSVLLTSAAVDVKAEGLTAVTDYSGSGREWKLTLLDKTRNTFHAEIRKEGTNAYVVWSDAMTGANEYVSALIKNSSGAVTYYGRLKNLSDTTDASGEVAIDFSGKMNDGDKLYVFNEQCNGDYKTDYASELKEMTIPADDITPVYSISADKIVLDFGYAYIYDASFPAERTVTITNTGNQQITLKQPTSASTNYTIGTLSKADLAPGETATFTVQPDLNLTAGVYNEFITVQDIDGRANIISIQANFTMDYYIPSIPECYIGVSASPAEGGSVTGEDVYYIYDSVTVTATANSGYRFVAWTEDGKQVSTDASYTFQADGNRDLVAVFEQEGTTHTHTWGEWVSNGDGTHSRTCTGDSTHIETENCSGGTATCVSEAVCAVCKAVYGNKDMSNHAGGTEVRGRVEATADSEGYTGDTWCLGCNTKIAAGEVIPKKDSVSGGDSGNVGNDTPSASDEEEDDEDSTPATNTQTGTANAAEAVDNAPTFVTCTIQKGDTLGAIARRYGCTVSEIMAANSDLIKNPNRIYLGWQLKIPQKKAAGTGTTTDITLSDGRKTASYIVKRGDSLWAIARKNGCTVSEILALNKDLITNPGMILAGWELKVPQK